MNVVITTEDARKKLALTLLNLKVSKKLGKADLERNFLIEAVRYVEALKRSQNASECALAAKLTRHLESREYDLAAQKWSKRK